MDPVESLINVSAAPSAAEPGPSHWLDRLTRQAVLSHLEGLRYGALTVVEDGVARTYGQVTPDCPLAATLHVHDARFYVDVAFGGSVGAGEAYMRGSWSTDDLTMVVRVLLRNRDVIDGMEAGWARLFAPARHVLHWAARNTKRGSRKNIAAHYDLGNDFFRLFLDPTMMYSCAFFENAGATLEQASTAKLERICRKLQLRPGEHVIEIGTGWGGFALHAASRHGCRVTTTTISRQQYELARERVAAAGLSERVEVLFEDYRDVRGQYDKLVSIEMIEAVGHQYFDTYFRQCSTLLKPQGLMLLQSSTIADQFYRAATQSVDFIQRFIFPGACLPSVSVLCETAARTTDMRLVHFEDIGPHYVTTLARWRANLLANIDAVRALGFSEEFLRMWLFYFSYSEGGFAERALGVAQMLFAKPLSR